VCADLHDASAVDHRDAVGGGGLGESVGDDEGRATAGHGESRPLEHPAAGTARLRRRLVEHGHGSATQGEAGQRHLLGLRRGEAVAALADDGGGPGGQPLHPRRRSHRLEGGEDGGVGRVGSGEADVVGQ
jgi:hypothetical protein